MVEFRCTYDGRFKEAREQWVNHDVRFGEIPDYVGARLEAPVLPDQ